MKKSLANTLVKNVIWTALQRSKRAEDIIFIAENAGFNIDCPDSAVTYNKEKNQLITLYRGKLYYFYLEPLAVEVEEIEDVEIKEPALTEAAPVNSLTSKSGTMKSIVAAKDALKAAEKQRVFAAAKLMRANNRYQAEEAQEMVDDSEVSYNAAAEKWEKVEAKALAEIADLERRISNLQSELSACNPYASQEESEQHWNEIPHAIHSLQVKVERIKAQLNA